MITDIKNIVSSIETTLKQKFTLDELKLLAEVAKEIAYDFLGKEEFNIIDVKFFKEIKAEKIIKIFADEDDIYCLQLIEQTLNKTNADDVLFNLEAEYLLEDIEDITAEQKYEELKSTSYLFTKILKNKTFVKTFNWRID